jgi:hypothetical protein
VLPERDGERQYRIRGATLPTSGWCAKCRSFTPAGRSPDSNQRLTMSAHGYCRLRRTLPLCVALHI